MVDQPDANPYQSPATRASEEQPATAKKLPRRLIRWRVIPVALLYIYGGAGLLVPIEASVCWLIWLLMGRDDPRGELRLLGMALPIAAGIGVTFGCTAIYAARSLWRGEWMRGTLAALAAIAVYAIVATGLSFSGVLK